MILTADIGASKVKIAGFEIEKNEPVLKHVERYVNREHDGFISMLQLFIKTHSPKSVQAVAIGAAGVVENNVINLTNLKWTLSAADIQKAVQAQNVFLLNDVEAHGYGVSALKKEDVITLQEGIPRSGNKAFIAVGTGLGQSILFRHGQEHVPCASEGGHAGFSPCNDEEEQLLTFLRARYPEHVSWERVVSGKFGFRNIFDFLIHSGKIKSDDALVLQLKDKPEVGQDLQDAAAKGHVGATLALQWFATLFGSETGNLALKSMSVEGVYLGGGIARRHAELLTKNSFFMTAFNSKGRMTNLLKNIPVHLVIEQNLAVRGLAYFAAQRLR